MTTYTFTLTGTVTVPDADRLVDSLGPVIGVQLDGSSGPMRLDARTAVIAAIAATAFNDAADGPLADCAIDVTNISVVE